MTLRKQSIWGIALKALSIGISFVIVAILARILGPEAYGIYAVVMATVTILAVPTALGLPNYVVREVAKAMSDTASGAEGASDMGPGRIRRLVNAAAGLVLVVSALVVGGMVLWALLTATGASYRATLWYGLALIPIMALILVFGAALRAIGRVERGILLGLVLRHILFCVLLAGWLIFGTELTPDLAMALHLGAGLVALSFGVLSWLALRPAFTSKAPVAKVDLRAMLMSTGVMGIIAGAVTLNANLDVIMLGALAGPESAGLYKLAATAALLTVAGLQAINAVMMPHFARVHREGNHAALQNLATRSVKLILLTAMPPAVILILFGPQILTLAFGVEYAASYTPMVILILGQMVSAFFGSVITILNMTGHEMETMKGVLAASLVNVVLNAALIPPFGTEGAAVATAITVVCWNVLLHRVIRRRLSINSTPFASKPA